jgi:hypothetical protein
MSTGFLFGLAAGIVTGATIWSPATARPLDAYADPYAPAPVPDPPVVLAMPAAPHFGVTVHQTVETRLLEIELLDWARAPTCAWSRSTAVRTASGAKTLSTQKGALRLDSASGYISRPIVKVGVSR